MRFQRIAQAIYYEPWLITPSAHASVRQLLESKLAGDEINLSDFVNARPEISLDENGIAHIHVVGVIGKGLSKIEKSCGNTGVEDLLSELQSARDQKARGLLLHVNSPGGTIAGIPEVADEIASLSKQIPISAFTDDMMASAAYWIASSANTIWATRSSEIGSIGVYIPWIDAAGAWEKEGLKADPITNTGGDLKAIGFAPSLTDVQRQYLQESVDETFAAFKNHVLKSRARNGKTISNDSMRGQTFSGIKAMDVGLVDYVGSTQDAYDTLFQETRRRDSRIL